jgi:hypothetical protein
MNNTFDMQRFLRLFNKYAKEHLKTHLMSLGVLIGVLIITMGYIGYKGGLNDGTQLALFTFFLIFGGTVFASMAFSDLSESKKALTTLMLPVSNLERFLVTWIYSFVIFQIVFIACFYVVDFAILKILNSYARVPEKLVDFTEMEPFMYFVFLYFACFHGASFLGSIVFKKLHFIKTALAVFSFVFLLMLLNQVFVHLLIGTEVRAAFPFSALEIPNGTKFHYIQDKVSSEWIATTMLSMTALCLWTATYFRLREKQI